MPGAEPRYARTPAGGFYVQGGLVSLFSGAQLPYERLERPPTFVPKGQSTCHRLGGPEEPYPSKDSARGVGGALFHLKHGRVDEIRHLDATEVVAALDALDAEREALRIRLREIEIEKQRLMAEAWPLAKSVTAAELKSKETV